MEGENGAAPEGLPEAGQVSNELEVEYLQNISGEIFQNLEKFKENL